MPADAQQFHSPENPAVQDILRLAGRAPRYTSYPTAVQFSPAVDETVYRGWLAALPPDETVSLYLHLPFCDRLCWFCGCHTTVVHQRGPVEAYVALLLRETPLYRTMLFLAECYAAIWVAFAPALGRPALDPPADLSYGVYLYGWPIQQALYALFPHAPVTALLAASLVPSLGVAALSWYAVEKPALRLKARAMGRRTIGTIEPAGP